MLPIGWDYDFQQSKNRDLTDLERYQEYEKMEWVPFIGGFYTRAKNRLYEEENKRYWDDYYRNTGANRTKYPIKQYLGERHYVDGGLAQDLFEATETIINLYRRF